MSMFSELFKHLPDAEQLLNLEPEALAGPLLISLEGIRQIDPVGLISYKNMKQEIDSNPQIKYPNGCHEDVLFALMEAWQWLEREGFVAPRPTALPSDSYWTSSTKYFVTRQGKRIQTSVDLEAYRKADLLPKHQLHPIIAQKAWSIFLQGDYDTTVFQAFKQVEVAVRNAGGYETTDIGVSLMRKAFDKNNGKLTDMSQHDSEREAKAHLFAGAIGLYKNPSSHRDVEITAENAVEIIIIASHLLRLVDECEERIANSST